MTKNPHYTNTKCAVAICLKKKNALCVEYEEMIEHVIVPNAVWRKK